MPTSSETITGLKDTIVDGAPHLRQTLAGAGAAGGGTLLPATGGGTGGLRTTVLPRIDVVDGQPVVVPNTLHRYEAVALLGQGGGGRVDKARDNDIGRSVAVKRLHAELSAPTHIARFVEEIRLVGQLEHPNIVPIHDVGVDERGEYFFVMKYVEGETVERIIERLAAGDPDYHDRYPFERRLEIFAGILDAVHYAHARGIVHRDLKPANVMVGPFGEVMVMDWGIARRVGDPQPAPVGGDAPAAGSATPSLTAAGGLTGTPLYMSPEQARGEPAGVQSDVYSLSVLLYEFLTLKHPLADKQSLTAVFAAILTEEPPAASFVSHPHQPAVPMDLTWYLKAGLAKDPARRFPSVAAMLERLHARAEGRIPIQCHITFLKRMGYEVMRVVDHHPIAVTTALTLGMALAGVGVYFAMAQH